MKRKPSQKKVQFSSDTAERILTGRRVLGELLRHASNRVSRVVLREGSKLPGDLDAELSEFEAGGGLVTTEPAASFDRKFGDTVHQGVAVEVKGSSECSLAQLIDRSLSGAGRGVIVVLDCVTDPHNLGAVFRVAEAAGADGIVFTSDRSAELTAQAVKASAGTAEVLPHVKVTNLQRAIRELKKHGIWVAATALEENAKDLYQVSIPRPVALIFGSEGSGVRPLSIKESDIVLRIPMQGVVESLNVSQAASVVLFEVFRQRRTEEE